MMLGSLSYGMRQAAVPVEVYELEEAVQGLRRTDDTPEQLEDLRKKVQYLIALGYKPLHLAAHFDRPLLMQELLKAGASVGDTTHERLTPLHCAALVGDTRTIGLLLRWGASLMARDENGLTPLHYAARKNSLALAYLLTPEALRGGGIIGDSTDEATFNHSEDAKGKNVQKLTDPPINAQEMAKQSIAAFVNTKTDKGFTALHFAAMLSTFDSPELKCLLAHGALVNERTNEGFTALHFAAQAHSPSATRVLLDSGAILDVRSFGEGLTPLHCAALTGNAAISYLLPLASIPTTAGLTALHYAAQSACRDTVWRLLNDNPEPLLAYKDALGQNPLHYAARAGEAANFHMLVRHFGEESAFDQAHDGFTPLHLAALYGHTKILEDFENSALDRAITPCGLTLWHSAALGNQEKVLFLLTQRNSVSTAPLTATGLTPLDCAAQNGKVKALRFLVPPRPLLSYNYYDSTRRDSLLAQSENVLPETRDTELIFAAAASCQDVDILAKFKDQWMLKIAQWRDSVGRTLLMAALGDQNKRCVKWLLENGLVEIGAQDKFAHDALWWAVNTGCLEFVNIILGAGGIVTPEHVYHAAKNDFTSIATQLAIKSKFNLTLFR